MNKILICLIVISTSAFSEIPEPDSFEIRECSEIHFEIQSYQILGMLGESVMHGASNSYQTRLGDAIDSPYEVDEDGNIIKLYTCDSFKDILTEINSDVVAVYKSLAKLNKQPSAYDFLANSFCDENTDNPNCVLNEETFEFDFKEPFATNLKNIFK